jgi:hypothetical protein
MQSDFDSTLWTVIHGARRGDEESLRQFVLRYRAPVIAFAAKRVPAADAEDISQEVFVRLIHDGVLAKADPSKGRLRSPDASSGTISNAPRRRSAGAERR